MITKSISYIKNINLFSNVNFGKNGLLSIEGFFLLLISALMLTDIGTFTESIKTIIKRDVDSIPELMVIFGTLCIGLMILIYVITIFLAKDKDHAINNFSWTIIVIFINSSVFFFLIGFSGRIPKNIIIYNREISILFVVFIVLLSLIASAKQSNYRNVLIKDFIKMNLKSIIGIYVSCCLYMVIFLP